MVTASSRKTASRTPKSAKKRTVAQSAGSTSARRDVAAKAKQAPRGKRTEPAATEKASAARPKSKQAKVLAMLRATGGTTIEAIVLATGWQSHSVRGFLAGVVRKKLGLHLTSEVGEAGRIYKVIDDHASTASSSSNSSIAA